jgi:hypothetical protein
VDAPDSPGGWWGVVWPVGGIYLSAVDGDPADLFGFGTWQSMGKGAVLIGADGVGTPQFASSPNPNAIPTVPVYLWVRRT